VEIQGGGNAGNALTAMARLGVTPAILTKLSDDGAGKAILDEFAVDGVDTSAVVVEPGKSSPFTYIIVDRAGSTRTCIHTPGPEFTPEEMPHDAIVSMLDGASLLYFDGRLTEVALKVAAVAQDMGVPMLVEGERARDGLDKLLLMGDYVVTSTGYPKAATGEEGLEAAMVKLAASLPRAKALITTLGSRGAVMLQRVDDWGEGDDEAGLYKLHSVYP
jgi:sugar/nucleoside kinase (ribokinase family)